MRIAITEFVALDGVTGEDLRHRAGAQIDVGALGDDPVDELRTDGVRRRVEPDDQIVAEHSPAIGMQIHVTPRRENEQDELSCIASTRQVLSVDPQAGTCPQDRRATGPRRSPHLDLRA